MSKTTDVLSAMHDHGLDNAPAIADFLGFPRHQAASILSKLGNQGRIVRVGDYVRPEPYGYNLVRRTGRWIINPERGTPMAYISDRQRVEFLLLAQMAWAILEAGVDDQEHVDFKACRTLLTEATREPVNDMIEPARSKIIRRAGRLHLEITAPYRHEGARVDKVGLMWFFLMKSLTDCEYLVLGGDSNMQKALDLLLPALEHAAAIEPLVDSAKKQSAKMLSHLQSLGYFGGVEFAA